MNNNKTSLSVDKKKRKLTGIVISSTNSMDKTIVVEVARLIKHPILKKYYKRSVKYKVHDEANVAKKGDNVAFYQTRPISKTKSFMLDSIV